MTYAYGGRQPADSANPRGCGCYAGRYVAGDRAGAARRGAGGSGSTRASARAAMRAMRPTRRAPTAAGPPSRRSTSAVSSPARSSRRARTAGAATRRASSAPATPPRTRCPRRWRCRRATSVRSPPATPTRAPCSPTAARTAGARRCSATASRRRARRRCAWAVRRSRRFLQRTTSRARSPEATSTAGATTAASGSATVRRSGSTPTPGLTLAGPATHVFTGGDHACAVLAAGTAWCWGHNDGPGALGLGTTHTDVRWRARRRSSR